MRSKTQINHNLHMRILPRLVQVVCSCLYSDWLISLIVVIGRIKNATIKALALFHRNRICPYIQRLVNHVFLVTVTTHARRLVLNSNLRQTRKLEEIISRKLPKLNLFSLKLRKRRLGESITNCAMLLVASDGIWLSFKEEGYALQWKRQTLW